AGSVLTEKTTLAQYGRTWTIVYRYHPDRILTFWQLILPDLTIYGGLIFALLFCLLVLSLTYSRRAALRLAAQMTEALLKFKLAVDSANSHIILTDPDGKILYANPAVEAITGYTPKEVLGNNPRLWGGLMEKEFYEKMWHQIKEEKRPWKGELKNRRKNGEIYVVLSTISPIFDENKNLVGFVGLEDDITAKVQANEALEEQKRILEEEKAKDEAILAGIGDGVVVVDEKGKILLINGAGQKLLGWSDGGLVGKLYFEAWSLRDNLGNTITARRPIEISLSFGETVSTSDYYLTRKDGSDFPVHITVSPVKLEEKLIGAVMVFRDVTAEKAIDRAKSEFVSLASHQLRTPLSAVSWYTEMLLSGDLGPVAEGQKKYIEEIHESNKRMVELVNALLNVSRIDLGTFAIEPESVNLVEIAKSVVAELQPQIVFKKLTFSENYDPAVPVIQADPKLIRIIMGNLVTNAVKYTSAGGKGELGIRLIKAGETEGGKRMTLDGIMIKVGDSGYGIPENQKDKVFTKLFRADNVKEKDTEGTGLGLYIVKSIVDAAAGLIWFESVENQGSTFYVFLPLSGMPRKAGAKQLGSDVFNKIANV
ncbi:MAG: PAS domain-containing sensor histidine kinase, partial [Microgenomates group bacterium]